MKQIKLAKILSAAMIPAILLTSFACSKAEPKDSDTSKSEITAPENEKQDWKEDGIMKILCIGNSFSVNTMEYLYDVLKDLGVQKIKLGNLYIGGCSLFTHYANAKNDSPSYMYYQNTTGSWRQNEGQTISEVVKSENWDFISFQQASHDSGVESTYRYLSKLIELVAPLCPDARLVWNMTWAYQKDSTHGSFPIYKKDQTVMYNSIISAVQNAVLTESSIEKVSPTGTAIQNARAGWIGDTITADGFHLSKFGCYVAALTFASALTDMSVENVRYAPSGLTDAHRALAIEASTLAIKKPFEVSIPTSEAPN